MSTNREDENHQFKKLQQECVPVYTRWIKYNLFKLLNELLSFVRLLWFSACFFTTRRLAVSQSESSSACRGLCTYQETHLIYTQKCWWGNLIDVMMFVREFPPPECGAGYAHHNSLWSFVCEESGQQETWAPVCWTPTQIWILELLFGLLHARDRCTTRVHHNITCI